MSFRPVQLLDVFKKRIDNRRVISVLSWAPAVFFFLEYVYSISWVEGQSMAPTFSPDGRRETVLLSKWGVLDSLKPGQVIVFR